MKNSLTFLFYHYGKIPRYLRNAIEHVRIFNPEAEIMLITDGIEDVSMLTPFDVRHHEMSDFPSPELNTFRRTYRHISCFKERYERFVLERWFVTESIRRQRPDRVYIMQDSDVAVFGDALKLLPILPDCPICLSSINPHFTFVKKDMSDFLKCILSAYADDAFLSLSRAKHVERLTSSQIFNLGEMEFLFRYLDMNRDMQVYDTNTNYGYVDINIHLPEGFDFIPLRRRPRKKVFWQSQTDGRLIPYFRRNGDYIRAFLVHFQGPGKRVFFRFNKSTQPSNPLRIAFIQAIFQNKLLANLS
jgi:hypothetical protein